MSMKFHWACLAGAAAALVVAGCTSSTTPTTQPTGPVASASASTTPASTAPGSSAPAEVVAHAKPVHVDPLESGERWINLSMPGGTYTPEAAAGGTDDYRCILFNPKLKHDAFLSGVVLQPGNPKLVHHAILYRVEPGQVQRAEQMDASDPRLGWSCFGGPMLAAGDAATSAVGQLDSAPWVAAFATTGGEQRFAAGTGERIAAGSRLVLQMHYNLLNGTGPDNTSLKLRVAKPSANLTPLHTYLMPAPVELPCPAGVTGPLCDRNASIADVMRRFGPGAGTVIGGLQLLCDGSLTDPHAGSTQSCTRPVQQTMQIRAVAGHMHLLGRSIRVDLLRADGTNTNLINVKVWDFDDQRARVLSQPVTARPGDQLKVTCRHDAKLRQELPELKNVQPRYVVWGEGSSDEMCLGIISYTD